MLESESFETPRGTVHSLHLTESVPGRCRGTHRALVLSKRFLRPIRHAIRNCAFCFFFFFFYPVIICSFSFSFPVRSLRAYIYIGLFPIDISHYSYTSGITSLIPGNEGQSRCLLQRKVHEIKVHGDNRKPAGIKIDARFFGRRRLPTEQ